VISREVHSTGYNLTAIVLVDEASRGELGVEAMAKHLGEATLMVVVSVGGRVANAANVDDYW
jgi:hypothetical protein